MLPLSKGCCLFPSFVVWSVLCGCGFLTSLFGLLSGPAGWLCLIYDSLELMVQNQDLCLWCCDWTSPGSLASSLLSVSPSLSLTCSLWMWWATAGEWVGCWSASPHSTSFVFVPPPFLPEESGCRLAGDPAHLQTRPPDLVSPFYFFSSLKIPQHFFLHTEASFPVHSAAELDSTH